MNLKIIMECYAGYRGEESPRRFRFGERSVDILDIIDRWIAPECRYYKVRASDGGVYIFRHDIANDSWELTMFDSGAYPDFQLSST